MRILPSPKHHPFSTLRPLGYAYATGETRDEKESIHRLVKSPLFECSDHFSSLRSSAPLVSARLDQRGKARTAAIDSTEEKFDEPQLGREVDRGRSFRHVVRFVLVV